MCRMCRSGGVACEKNRLAHRSIKQYFENINRTISYFLGYFIDRHVRSNTTYTDRTTRKKRGLFRGIDRCDDVADLLTDLIEFTGRSVCGTDGIRIARPGPGNG